MSLLPSSFFLSDDVVTLSQTLLGKFIVTHFQGQTTSGMIIETEAYKGIEDKASHAYNNRRTARTETMFQKGGISYIYLCYGMHHLFNVVTAPEGVPHAILVRAILPVDGINIMLKRRKMKALSPRLSAGPGTLTQSLGITTALNGTSLTQGPIVIEDRGIKIAKKNIVAGPRVGIDYAQEHRLLPWRFRISP